ncbi:MAG: efflux RND transporter periplasmic adaptor subunit [Planctomycetales bacterium]|nr:efflux RND transporter periplasmic adaptor subunit [Planctomycetales bacterium]
MKEKQIIIVILTVVVAVAVFFAFRKQGSQPAAMKAGDSRPASMKTEGAPPATMKMRGSKPGAMQMAGPMPIPVAPCVIQDVVSYNEFTGNLASVESVDIRARVQGFLRHVAFTDGAFVKKGDLLFEIESETYQADRSRALANLKSAQSDLSRTQQDYDRVVEAVQSGAVSKQDVTTSQARRDMAQAVVLATEAALAQAELNLGYTRICSPIDGKISRRFVDAGNLVGAPEMTLLARIVRLDPLYVYFNVSESEYLDYQKNLREKMAEDPNKLPVYIWLANDEDYAHQGRLDYMDNRVDSATGTIQIRGEVPNPENMLYPGMFVQIRVPVETVRNAILVPEKAIMTDLGGKYLLVVGENNILQRCDITPGATLGELRVVKKGLTGKELFIVGGFAMARPGMPITPLTGGGPPAGKVPGNTATPSDKQ